MTFSKQLTEANVRVAVIGLGVMGRPIAAHLVRAGFEVVGHTRSPAKLWSDRPSRVAGAAATTGQPLPFTLAATASEAIEAAEVVLLAVPALDDVDRVLGRTPTGFACPVAGRTVALLATVDPAGSAALGEQLAQAGAEYVEAPVAGSAAQAEDAQLLVLASAARPEAVERLAPVFAAFAKRTTWCGPPPNAMTIKLANNLVQIGLFEALAEATLLVERARLDLGLFYDVLNGGAMANRVLEAKTAKLLAGDLSPQAPLRHVRKDIGLVRARAEQLGLDLPGVRAAERTLERALAAGLGELDAMAVVRVLGEWRQ